MPTTQPRPKRHSSRVSPEDAKKIQRPLFLELAPPAPEKADDTELPKRRTRRRGKRGGGSARRKNAARAAMMGDHPPLHSEVATSSSALSLAVWSPNPDAASANDTTSPLAATAAIPSPSGFSARPHPPAVATGSARHSCATTSPINPVFGEGVDGHVPTQAEAGRAPSLKSPLRPYNAANDSSITPLSIRSQSPSPLSHTFVGNHFLIPVDNLPVTKPFSLDTPRFSEAQIGVPKPYNAEYPHPLTAYASPAVNPSTVATSHYGVLLDDLLNSDPDGAMGSILANSGKEGIGPPALTLHRDSKDGCGIPENLWLQLTTWDSVKVPVGTVVPVTHPSRFGPGSRLPAMIDRSRRVLPPVAGRQTRTSEPSSSRDLSTLRRSLSTGNLDTFLRSWSELATATNLVEGHRRMAPLVASDQPPSSPLYYDDPALQRVSLYMPYSLTPQHFDLPPTAQLRPRMSLPFNILSPVAEEENNVSLTTAVVERSPFPSPSNFGFVLADPQTPRDPSGFIPSFMDEADDPDLSHPPETPLTPPLDWSLSRNKKKPPADRHEDIENLEHTHSIFLPSGVLVDDDQWEPLATTTLDFSTGNSIWA